MKCMLCAQKKAKRPCPAKDTLICAPCCGQKRVLEIDCPESCVFLKTGREMDMQNYAKHFRSLDPGQYEKHHRVVTEDQIALTRIEQVIARERLSDRNLKDKDVVGALSILIETYKTEDKGVLYEKTSEDLRIESLRRILRNLVESLRNPEGQNKRGIVDAQSKHLPLASVIDCLEFLRALAESYIADRESAYVDFLVRLFPREEKRDNSILVP